MNEEVNMNQELNKAIAKVSKSYGLSKKKVLDFVLAGSETSNESIISRLESVLNMDNDEFKNAILDCKLMRGRNRAQNP